ncbi:hypothetical protein [Flexithrix dorotheae]|uniref:hypothetical protein n=1 Tax=Flexithrix dorotheae TaxID=70993 RepID=UPI00035ECA51|nr:hypothetical protein [Flexithrix dorotheae]
MKKLIYILFLLFIFHESIAQKVRLGFDLGYGTYQMSQLKEFQEELIDLSPVKSVQIVEQFPAYFNYSANLDYYQTSRSLLLGLNLTYFTTGGRNHVKDYSGEYKLDMPLRGYRIGIQLRSEMLGNEKWKLYNKVKIGGILTSLELEESIVVYDEQSDLPGYSFSSEGIFIEPSLGLSYEIVKKIHFDLSFGYQLDASTGLYLSGFKGSFIQNSSNDKVSVNWSGFRTYLGVAYDIF